MSESIIEPRSPREMEQYLREELGVGGVTSSAEDADVLVTLEKFAPDGLTTNDLPGLWCVERGRHSTLIRIYRND